MKSLELVAKTLKDDQSRTYWDFAISGEPLKSYLRLSAGSSVTRLGWFGSETTSRALRELRLQTKSKLKERRVELYVCAACGDIGCGSITVKIQDYGDRIVWTDFADTEYEDEIGKVYDVKPVAFNREQYFRALSRFK